MLSELVEICMPMCMRMLIASFAARFVKQLLAIVLVACGNRCKKSHCLNVLSAAPRVLGAFLHELVLRNGRGLQEDPKGFAFGIRGLAILRACGLRHHVEAIGQFWM